MTKVCVIFGGRSSEHNVSLITARNVIMNLDKSKYDVICVGITKSGEWLLYDGDVSLIENGEWEKKNTYKTIISPDTGDKAIIKFKGTTYEKIKIDVAYLAVHGEFVEDGALQGLLELSGIPYTGPKVLSSAVCMDKDISRLILKEQGIPVVEWLTFYARDLVNIDAVVARVRDKFDYPVFVKPCCAGSSIGASRANSDEELIDALKYAEAYGNKILVEQNVDAREIECGVIGNDEPQISLLGEAVAADEFYTYEAKYDKSVTLPPIIPAEIGEDYTQKITEYARQAYKILECRGLCRIDFFIDKVSGKIYLNELNTLPGCTDSSMFPVLWQKTGKTFTEVLDIIISCALVN